MDWTTLLFSFTGRINRGKYWLATLIYALAWIAFIAAAIMWLGGFDTDRLFSFVGAALLLWLTAIVLLIISTWSAFATGIKRLHDRGKSGWWIVLFWFGPGLLSGSNSAMSGMEGNIALSFIGFVIAVWGFIELYCLRGTSGPNEYGPDPLGGPPPLAR